MIAINIIQMVLGLPLLVIFLVNLYRSFGSTNANVRIRKGELALVLINALIWVVGGLLDLKEGKIYLLPLDFVMIIIFTFLFLSGQRIRRRYEKIEAPIEDTKPLNPPKKVRGMTRSEIAIMMVQFWQHKWDAKDATNLTVFCMDTPPGNAEAIITSYEILQKNYSKDEAKTLVCFFEESKLKNRFYETAV